jgi:hypothetical protein
VLRSRGIGLPRPRDPVDPCRYNITAKPFPFSLEEPNLDLVLPPKRTANASACLRRLSAENEKPQKIYSRTNLAIYDLDRYAKAPPPHPPSSALLALRGVRQRYCSCDSLWILCLQYLVLETPLRQFECEFLVVDCGSLECTTTQCPSQSGPISAHKLQQPTAYPQSYSAVRQCLRNREKADAPFPAVLLNTAERRSGTCWKVWSIRGCMREGELSMKCSNS